ncbi:MAG: PLP-dependent aminotransferase family protein [Gluconobacter sp.]|uniref:aminotransferase-like domain-containing protein n=1 Tax=Gluconobacter sp. TaxID=1876758 RepID=UPI0039EB7ED2
MTDLFAPLAAITLNRQSAHSLNEQIALHVERAIFSGVLPAGSRLPSWRDLATQLGVARGTVRTAYDRLIDRGLLCATKTAGTRVVEVLPILMPMPPAIQHSSGPGGVTSVDDGPLALFQQRADRPLAFQMGVPAHDAFPATLWARMHRRGVQASALNTGVMDPCGLPELRAALASHLALARGVHCSPEQILITTGFRSGLAMVLRAIDSAGKQAWVEDPGFPITRLALVTPGQQAPTGVSLSPERRRALLDWARQNNSWIIEDDYLAELHLDGQASPALAAGDGADRVIHIGTFSKTLAPMIGLGFVVAPQALVKRLTETAWWLATPPNNAVQIALTHFMREGHYFRHLRRTRQIYTERRELLRNTLLGCGASLSQSAGLSLVLPLPSGFDDVQLAHQAQTVSLGVTPLSAWFAKGSRARSGVLLGVANVRAERVEADCRQLLTLMHSTL